MCRRCSSFASSTIATTVALFALVQEVMDLLKEDFEGQFPRYKMYMYVAAVGEVGLTSHLDGRKYVSDERRPDHWKPLKPV